MGQGSILAVMGSPGSGKTTLSMKLAAELAAAKKNVAVVFCDPYVPPLPYLVTADTSHETSLGELLTAPALTQKMILDACIPVKETEYVSFLGYKTGENPMSFPKVTRDRGVDFFVCIRPLADFIILDCASLFETDLLSILALELADQILKVGTSDLKGISYFKSHAALLTDRKFLGKKQVSVIGNYRTGQEWEAVDQQYGGVFSVVPYAGEVERQFYELSLLERAREKESLAFRKEITVLAEELFSLPGEEKGTGKEKADSTVREDKHAVKKEKTSFRIPHLKRKGEF